MRSTVISVVTIATVLGGTGAPALAAAKPALKFTKIQYDAPGADTRANSQLNKEYLVLKNTGRTVVRLKNWTLHDAQNHRYRFPAFTLKPGKSVTVHTGRGRNSAAHLYMNRGWYIWNNDRDTATLRNAQGTKVISRSWKKKAAAPKPPASTNDPRFRTCTEAKANGYGPYHQGQDPEYHWYIDRDGDGVVCE